MFPFHFNFVKETINSIIKLKDHNLSIPVRITRKQVTFSIIYFKNFIAFDNILLFCMTGYKI